MKADRLLTGPQAAKLVGVAPGTWRAYVARGQAPAPDDPDEETTPSRRNPRWKASTVEAFMAARRGQGWRKGA